MRFYNIIIQDTQGKLLRQYTSSTGSGANAGTSNVGDNPNALRVHLDITQNNFNTLGGALGIVRIWGINYEDISAANDFNQAIITVYVGMSKGLPLADPSQQGIIIQGSIFQCFGNWQGNEVTIDFVISSLNSTASAPANIVLDWKKNTSLTTAVSNSLTTAYPGYKVYGEFDPTIIANQDTTAFYPTLASFSKAVYTFSKSKNVNPIYPGANITIYGKGFFLFDGTKTFQESIGGTSKSSKYFQINFTDLIGNATWIDNAVMQFKTVMRGDLSVGMEISMPKGSNILNQTNTFTTFKQNVNFQNNFRIFSIRHVGDSRQAGADSWVTIVDCNLLKTANVLESTQ